MYVRPSRPLYIPSIFCLGIVIFGTLTQCKSKATFSEEGFLKVFNNQVHYKAQGDGSPLLFVHGGNLNLDAWEPQVSYFTSRGFKVLRFSDIGHGQTSTGDSLPFGFEIINRLVEKHTDQPVTLCGLSWGATLCMDFALNYPEKVTKLLLISPGLNGWNYFQDSIADINYQARKIAEEADDTLEVAKLFHQNWVVGPRRTKEDIDSKFYHKTLDMVRQTFQNHWQEEWSKLDTIQAIHRLHEIQAETLILTGQDDAEDIHSVSDLLNTQINNSTLVSLPNVAHSINMEDPMAFNQLVGNFLE